jgi:hypothetical protein
MKWTVPGRSFDCLAARSEERKPRLSWSEGVAGGNFVRIEKAGRS